MLYSLPCTGLNLDCAAVFVNGDSNSLQLINDDLFVEFTYIGPVETIECRFEPVGQDNGDFFPCKFQYFVTEDLNNHNHFVL